jgi:hypothetical protein
MLSSLLFSSLGGLFGSRGGGNIATSISLGGLGVGVDLVLAVLLDEVGKILDGSGPGVVNRDIFGTGGEELDSWEALDLLGDVVGGGINLGDGHFGREVRVLSVESTEGIVFGSKTKS